MLGNSRVDGDLNDVSIIYFDISSVHHDQLYD